ncbi:hypothetical protein SUDANB37_00997 [Streptomyces sp. enrichment culture]
MQATPGTGGGHQLGAGVRLPPLLLDDEEAVAVAVGLRTAAGRGVAGIGETPPRALAELDQVLPARLRRRVSAPTSYTRPCASRPTTSRRTRRSSSSRRAPAGTASGSASRTRTPTARAAAARSSRTGSCAPSAAGTRFEPRTPPAEDLAASVPRGVSTAAYAERAVTRLHASARDAAPVVGVFGGVVEAEGDTTCLPRTGAPTPDALVVHLMLLGLECEVVEPGELVGHLSSVRDRLNRALGRSAARQGPPGRPAPDAGTSRGGDGAGRTPGTPTG